MAAQNASTDSFTYTITLSISDTTGFDPNQEFEFRIPKSDTERLLIAELIGPRVHWTHPMVNSSRQGWWLSHHILGRYCTQGLDKFPKDEVPAATYLNAHGDVHSKMGCFERFCLWLQHDKEASQYIQGKKRCEHKEMIAAVLRILTHKSGLNWNAFCEPNQLALPLDRALSYANDASNFEPLETILEMREDLGIDLVNPFLGRKPPIRTYVEFVLDLGRFQVHLIDYFNAHVLHRTFLEKTCRFLIQQMPDKILAIEFPKIAQAIHALKSLDRIKAINILAERALLSLGEHVDLFGAEMNTEGKTDAPPRWLTEIRAPHDYFCDRSEVFWKREIEVCQRQLLERVEMIRLFRGLFYGNVQVETRTWVCQGKNVQPVIQLVTAYFITPNSSYETKFVEKTSLLLRQFKESDPKVPNQFQQQQQQRRPEQRKTLRIKRKRELGAFA